MQKINFFENKRSPNKNKDCHETIGVELGDFLILNPSYFLIYS